MSLQFTVVITPTNLQHGLIKDTAINLYLSWSLRGGKKLLHDPVQIMVR